MAGRAVSVLCVCARAGRDAHGLNVVSSGRSSRSFAAREQRAGRALELHIQAVQSCVAVQQRPHFCSGRELPGAGVWAARRLQARADSERPAQCTGARRRWFATGARCADRARAAAASMDDPPVQPSVPASPTAHLSLPAAPGMQPHHRKGKSSTRRAHKQPLLSMAPESQLAFPRESQLRPCRRPESAICVPNAAEQPRLGANARGAPCLAVCWSGADENAGHAARCARLPRAAKGAPDSASPRLCKPALHPPRTPPQLGQT